ncbi:MAG: L,D-transpeptidase family protein [Paracoccaceae bacterium]|nr:L,D-transpeptidase family protein [Paracoccaceae bacterium]
MTFRSADLVVTRWGARFQGRPIPCAVGRSGIGAKSREGDGLTPEGVFHVDTILFRPDRVRPHGLTASPWFRLCNNGSRSEDPGEAINPYRTARDSSPYLRVPPIPVRPILPGDIWSDDPEDPGYNSRVTAADMRGNRGLGTTPFSHERLRRPDPVYDIVAVLDFNRPAPVPGRGSAIFLHIWRQPRNRTEGCVAFRRQDLTEILTRWTPRSRVIIQR